jgi:hypothetical protein
MVARTGDAMRKSVSLQLIVAGMGISAPVMAQVSAEATAQSHAAPMANANDYICTFTSNVARAAVPQETARAVGPEMGQILFTYQWAVRGFAVRLPASSSRASVTARLKAHNANVRACEHDGITRAAVMLAGRPGGGGGGSTQTTPWGVTRVGGPGDASQSTKRAWIIDSGIDLTHKDLNVDAADGISFLSTDTSLNDTYGHGTHVAGIIGAKNNSIGVVGVAAGVRVVPIRVLNGTGTGPDSGVIAAINYVYQHASPGDVANLSLIADAVSDTMDQAVINLGLKGVFVTIAAGNNSADAGNYSPGRANGANVFTVSAFASGDSWASFSNYGSVVDWGEPGVSILSTYKRGGYTTLSGTSMAAPHLAGILLLQSAAKSDGTVSGDPDGNPDPIGVR